MLKYCFNADGENTTRGARKLLVLNLKAERTDVLLVTVFAGDLELWNYGIMELFAKVTLKLLHHSAIARGHLAAFTSARTAETHVLEVTIHLIVSALSTRYP